MLSHTGAHDRSEASCEAGTRCHHSDVTDDGERTGSSEQQAVSALEQEGLGRGRTHSESTHARTCNHC